MSENNIEEIKNRLDAIDLDLTTFSNEKSVLMANDIQERYLALQDLKKKFDEQKYKNYEYYEKLEFKSIVINNKIKNMLNTKKRWLLEKNKLITYYKKEIKIAEEYEKLNKDVESRLKELNDYIAERLQEEIGRKKLLIIKDSYLDYLILVGLLFVGVFLF